MRLSVFAGMAVMAELGYVNGLAQDFIVGFESGIFVRDDDNAFDDYSCDKPEIEKTFIHKMNSFVQPMKLMAGFSNDIWIEKMVTSVDKFINSLGNIVFVFSGQYDGGEFCSGLIFGKYGAKMLTEIADHLFKMPEDHNPSLKQKAIQPPVEEGRKRPVPKSVRESQEKKEAEFNADINTTFLQ